MFGNKGSGGFRQRQAKFRGEDYHAELQLNLTDVYKTHQQVLTVNNKSIRITIPAGVENGQQIKIKGHGGTGINGGPNGDLYITFHIINNTKFRRDGMIFTPLLILTCIPLYWVVRSLLIHSMEK